MAAELGVRPSPGAAIREKQNRAENANMFVFSELLCPGTGTLRDQKRSGYGAFQLTSFLSYQTSRSPSSVSNGSTAVISGSLAASSSA